jgi:hypothetical protein
VLLMATFADEVRRRYSESTRAMTDGTAACGCGSSWYCADDESDTTKFGEALDNAEQRVEFPQPATLASLDCNNPTAFAVLREGETVLDLRDRKGMR